MSADELQTALETLRTAQDRADGETADRLASLVEKVDRAVENGRTVDHGALAKMDRTLDELSDEESGETADAIVAAKEALSTYREGVPGA